MPACRVLQLSAERVRQSWATESAVSQEGTPSGKLLLGSDTVCFVTMHDSVVMRGSGTFELCVISIELRLT